MPFPPPALRCMARASEPRSYQDLRDFMAQLEASGELRRITEPMSLNLEMAHLVRPYVARQRPR